ncbi:MAG: hypothetical protein GF346_13650, partial [Candidatus Eisenbacteria bacterium]|nr:hypothetical protein [Candidatus Latescibacterota bacterium]MBD3303485.1 hypothetical protein [Candidatus Eisenbacteria bacterium]
MKRKTDGRRRGRSLWIAGGILGVLFLLLVAPFLSIRVAPLRAWILRESVERSLLPPGWTIRVDAVSRFDPWGLEMEGIHLDRRTPEGESAWASLSGLELRWRPLDLFRNRIWADRIAIDSLVVRGDRPVPRFERETDRSGGEGPPPEIPWLRLDAFRLGFRIVGEDRTLARGSVALGELEHRDGRIHAILREARVSYRPESVEVVVANGRVDGTLGESIRLRDLTVSSPGLRGTV